jgi:aryl-alcohol dehydrogenase-like predicted oxidoreductase
LGINFFDTAEVYGFGEAERQFGNAFEQLKTKREDIVLSSKLFWGSSEFLPNTLGLSRKHIMEGVSNSLRNLKTPYLDIVYCHRFDHLTSMEEICSTFDILIKQNKIHYWGTSEWSAANIFEAFEVCNKFKYAKPIVE